MGVPSFYRWLANKYPRVVQDVVDPTMHNTTTINGVALEYDNFYIDMNAIIHPCFHPDDVHNIPRATTFEDVFRNVFEFVDRLVHVVRPRKLLYMAIDGVAPRAKMNQQRSRRFRAAKDNEVREAEEDRLRKQYEMEGKQVLPKEESQVSDSNVITPGTEFMHELSKALQNYISSRISSDLLWKDIMVILSDANVPGEGEYKIISYLRKQRCLDEYDPNTRHCLYGSDADLIMLAMATHEPHFSILREDVPLQQQPKIVVESFNLKLKYLHIWLLREYLELDMKIEDPPKNFSIEFERIVDDFVFMCFFAGNDFLPHMPSLEIHEGAIDLLLTVYKKEFNKLGGYLVDMSRIGEKNAAFVKLSRVEKFILMVGTYEEKIFKKRSEIREKKLKRLISANEDAKQEKNADGYSELDNENSSDCAIVIKKASATKILVPASASSAENTKDLQDELKRSIREKGDLFKSGDFLIDKVKWGTPGYKERYYNVKFSVEGPTDIESKRKEIVLKYTEGLLWVLQYYFSGVASWTWFYPFHYGPFASDLRGMSQVKVKFEKGVPFLPLDQLLSVLPPGSASALPKAYAQLMLDENSRLIDLYPQDFEVDTEGKRFMWQAICKIPWIDERRLVAETRELKNELSENEAIRNSVKFDSLFIKSANKLADKICFLSQEPKSCKLDTRISSDGIGGIISLCHEEGIKKPCLGMEICDNKELHVLCVNYELPAGSNHIPRLLAGVELPQKTIFEDEIMETELWHEQQKHSRFERVHGQDKWRSENNKSITSKFSPNATTPNTKNFSPSVPHSHKGVGWGSGRGKPHLPPFHMDASGSCHVTNIRDTRSQHFVDNFRQLRVSETNHLARPSGRSQFRPHNNNYRYQSKNVGRFSSSVPHIEVIHKGAGVRWGSGRGRPSNSSNMDRVDTMANQKMPYLPPFHKDAVGSCDVTNIGDTRPQHFVDNVRQL
ncbi:hypothetical protein RJT34_31036 [Clitoria ternatea]|uniref:5'-3' exoribonuclease n=1 Tax=Clitoria ternatea TaxID=43366 RepID=A0AAN9EVQ4_CLITE